MKDITLSVEDSIFASCSTEEGTDIVDIRNLRSHDMLIWASPCHGPSYDKSGPFEGYVL